MYSWLKRNIVPLYIFVFSFFIISQLGKHFFFPFSYLSGIRIDYLAPTFYFSDLLSLPLLLYSIYSLVLQTPLRGVKQSLQTGGLPRRPSTNSGLPGNDIWTYFAIALLVILLIINYIFSLSQPLWFYNFARAVQFILLFIFFTQQGNKKRIFSAIIGGLLLGSCFELALSLLQLSARHSLQGWWYYLGERSFSIFTPGIAKAYFLGREFLRPYGTFSHPNSLAGFYLLIYAFILTQKRITNQLLKGFFLFISSALILVSFSRTAIITYALINLLYFSRGFFTCKTCFFAKISIALILILFTLGISGDMNSFQKRTDFFDKSLSIISQKPFTGTGIGSYLIAQHQYPQKFSTFFQQPVHNIFLLIIAQLGIPLSLFVFFLIYQHMKKYKKTPSFLFPLICVFISGNIDHYWITLNQNGLVLVIIFGIVWTCCHPEKSRDPG